MEQSTKTKKLIDKQYGLKAMNYETYKNMVSSLLADNKVTGPVQSESLLGYTKLNMYRMHRIEKTIQVLPEAKTIIEAIPVPQTWLVITEGWCGDAAQILPVLNAFATLNKNITLAMILRDENPELMDQYLTNGTSRSIPKLIVYNSLNNEELFSWGPRPAELQKKFLEMKSTGLAYDEIKEEIHRWYAKDHTFSSQKELSEILSQVSNVQGEIF